MRWDSPCTGMSGSNSVATYEGQTDKPTNRQTDIHMGRSITLKHASSHNPKGHNPNFFPSGQNSEIKKI